MKKAIQNQKAKNLRQQAGFIVSVEIIFLVTICVIGLLVGWVSIRDAVVFELHDVAEAVGSVNQSFYYRGVYDLDPLENTETAGGAYFDDIDTSDQIGIVVEVAPQNPSEFGLAFN